MSIMTLAGRNKNSYSLFTFFFVLLVVIGCKKNSDIQKAQKVENISLSELLQSNAWLQKTMPIPPVLMFNKAEKTFVGNTFFVRVPIKGSTGILYFAKEKRLESVFIRQLSSENVKGSPFTGEYEMIDFNSFTQRVFSFYQGKLVGAKKINLAGSKNTGESKYTTNTSWFSQLLYCLSHYILSVPGRDQNGDWTICRVFGSGEGSSGNEQESVQNFQPDTSGGTIDWAAFLASVIVPTNPNDPDPLPFVSLPGGGGNYTWVPFTSPSGSGSNIGNIGSNYEQVQDFYNLTVQTLATKVALNSLQLDWLNNNQDVANELLQILSEENEITNDIENATLITINLKMANHIDGPYDATYENLNSSQVPGLNIVLQKYLNYVWLNMAMLAIEHPNWSSFRLTWEATKETLQTGLDVLGLFPVIGSIADVANGTIYSFNGEGTMAALSFASAIPIGGWYAAGLKAAKKTISITATSKTSLRWILRTDNIVNFGNRAQLRRVQGLVAGNVKQAHHLIPWEFTDHAVIQTASKGANPFHMNELLNGIALDKSVHVEGIVHTMYNSVIETELNKIVSRYANNGVTLTPDLARIELEGLIGKITSWIQQHPGVNLNNIIIQ